ncbi:ABC-type metal ion transport system, periplasmic component/surface adhesin [Nostoc sp. PCC 7524]|uniref:metal ABC transporter solute-binding protein, Zn/Mn family n=1 Tax=Nostoc sp. (strain ATCC 29411 / PCC 7524) TaxID=28072 RepID=UPI00029EC45A|nr:ABC-type metal ion transport system, periplasmic component/surface adhesin [Nostoc sp. PCC 7524]
MSQKILKSPPIKFVLLFLTIGFFGCGNQAINTSFTKTSTTVNENLPLVVATTSLLCDLAKQVAENTINLTCIIPPNTDAQDYQPKPEDRTAIEQANLIFYNGYNLEPELIKLIKETNNKAPKIAVSQVALPKPQQFQINTRKVSNPYIWHNPKNGIKMVEVISSNLKKLEPNNTDIYQENTKRIKAELTQIDSWIKSRIGSIPEEKRRLVTTTNAIDYFTKAYGIPSASLGTEEQATDQRITNLVRYIQKSKVPTIFSEAKVNPELIESVATAAQVKLSERQLYTQGLGEADSNANSYQNMMFANTRTIVEGLGGTYLIFPPRIQPSQR